MLINELSKKSGVTIHTIRYYENLGLIKPEVNPQVSSNNYKNYTQRDLERLEIILEAKQVGFTLAEIKQLLTWWFEHREDKDQTIELFKNKIKEIDERILQFEQMRKRLEMACQEIQKDEC